MQAPGENGGSAVPQNAPSGHGTFCSPGQRRFVLVAAILASALGFIDGSVVAIAIPAIRTDLGATLAEAQWISNAYALTLSALILVGGAAGDKFGLRRTFVTGIALFIAASAVCAVAPDPRSLILARAAQGLAAAIMIPGSLSIIAKAYPKAQRGRAIGIWAASSALMTASGPVLGGFLLSAFDESAWRYIFAINLPVGGTAVYLLLAKVPDDGAAGGRKLDIAGAMLAAAGFGALAFGLTTLSAESGDAAPILAVPAFSCGILLLGMFLFWEHRHPIPMVNLALFRVRPFAGANLATFFLYFALSAILFYLPMLLIAGWGLSEASAAFIFLPLSLAIALLSGTVGRFSDRNGARLPIAAGSLIVAFAFAGLAVMSGAGLHGFWSGIFPLMILTGLGMALVVSPLSTAVMTSVDDADTGAASGINNAVSRIAGLIAVAAMGSVAAFRYASVLSDGGGGAPGFGEQPATALSGQAEALRIAASDAAFSAVAWTAAVLCVLAAILAWMTTPGAEAAKTPSEYQTQGELA
jgi:EmrB/QacA subfamily drug resistance transporter